MNVSPARVATTHDADIVTEILVGAFYADPLWSWAFPDDSRRREQQRALWSLFVEGAQRFPWVWLNADATATSVWLPPGEAELDAGQEARFDPLIDALLGAGAERVHAIVEALDDAHPHDEPHYYLSLLGTDPAQRGRGLGLALLAENLRRVDDEGLPAYLEASNEANVALYARYGFEPHTRVAVAGFDQPVVTMWRPARSVEH